MILDTNAVSALLAGNKQLGRKLGTADHHHLPLIVIGEYLHALLASRKRTKLQPLLTRLEAESIMLCGDHETVDWYATISRIEADRFPRTTFGLRHLRDSTRLRS